MKLIVWNIGTWAFVAVLWRTGWWREIVPLAVCLGAFLWVVIGGLWLAVDSRTRGQRGSTPADDFSARDKEFVEWARRRAKDEAAK